MNNSKRSSSNDIENVSIDFLTKNSTETAVFEQLATGQSTRSSVEHGYARKWYRNFLALPAYYWVLIAQVVIILPHAAHLPLWLIGFAVVSIIAQLPRIKAKFKKGRHLKRVYQAMQMLGFLLGLVGLW
nr:DUF3488 domain-containing protein [Psychrobacter sp.]